MSTLVTIIMFCTIILAVDPARKLWQEYANFLERKAAHEEQQRRLHEPKD